MKSEERHELKSNDLATLLSKVQPALEKHSTKIIFLAIAILVVGIGYVVISKNKEAARTAGWADMADAGSAEDFANIVDEHKGTAVARMAKLSQANLLYENGLRFMFSDRASGVKDLKKSEELYRSLLDNKKVSKSIRERSLFGLARCLETSSGENSQEAIDIYQSLVDEFPESIHKSQAELRIKTLATDESKDFYSWFQKQNPKPVDRAAPNDKTAPDNKETSEGDDKKTSTEKPEDKTKKAEDKKVDAPKTEAPKKPEDKKAKADTKESPQVEKPTAKKPVTEKKEVKKEAPKKEKTDKK